MGSGRSACSRDWRRLDGDCTMSHRTAVLAARGWGRVTDTDVVTAIRDVGVPAVILLIVLLRIEPKLDALIASIERLEGSLSARIPEGRSRNIISQDGGT